MTQSLSPFHLAIPVLDLQETRDFYLNSLGCTTGRGSESWQDLNFFGHQLVLHKVDQKTGDTSVNPVDSRQVPVPHFGVVLEKPAWTSLSEKLINLGTEFIIEPGIRFQGQAGEQGTFFLKDPSGNCLEFKYMSNSENLFASE